MIRGFAVVLLVIVLSSFGSFAQLNKGLIAHYPLNEGGGTIIVDKTRFNNGTLNNTALSSTSGWNLRKGIVLDGVNDNIQMGKSNISAMSSMTSMTASCWVKFNSTTLGGAGAGFVSKWVTPSSSGFVLRAVFFEYRFTVFIGGVGFTGAYPFTLDLEWHHIVGVYNGANVYCYVDGKLGSTIATTSGTIGYNSATKLNIGSYQLLNDYLNGNINNVMIWNRALTATEVRQLYVKQYNKR
jgi:hypothetical protein